MIYRLLKPFSIVLCLSMLFSCSDDNNSTGNDDDYTPIPVSPVTLDINAFPYATLSEYNFFEGEMKNQEPVLGVIPHKPISTLFTDYAKKKRFIWMPSGVQATYVDDHTSLNFPIGTVLIKTFYYDNVQPTNARRIIETRLMLRKNEGWVFADYVWNDEQTEATYSLDGSFTSVEWIEGGETMTANYRIPSQSECFTCHKSSGVAEPIGTKPQNLNSEYLFSDGSQNQLEKLIAEGYLEDNLPAVINTVVSWSDETQPLELRVRSYIDINCGHCHSASGHCDYRPVRFAFDESSDDANIGICEDPDTAIPGIQKIVSPSLKERSMMYFRMNTEDEGNRMPLLGRTVIHKEGVQLIGDWIDGLTTECDD